MAGQQVPIAAGKTPQEGAGGGQETPPSPSSPRGHPTHSPPDPLGTALSPRAQFPHAPTEPTGDVLGKTNEGLPISASAWLGAP